MDTQTQQTAESLQKAVMQAAVNSAVDATVSGEKAKIERAGIAPSPLNGVQLPPGAGRPVGTKNKLTNLRNAVLEAFDKVGGVDYLVRLANGTQSDRAAFTSLMNKVLPTQINQQVDGGIRLELSWLGGRSIGTTAAQVPMQTLQVIDVERDSGGAYRIKDPNTPSAGGDDTPAAGGAEGPGGPGPQEGLGGAGGA